MEDIAEQSGKHPDEFYQELPESKYHQETDQSSIRQIQLLRNRLFSEIPQVNSGSYECRMDVINNGDSEDL